MRCSVCKSVLKFGQACMICAATVLTASPVTDFHDHNDPIRRGPPLPDVTRVMSTTSTVTGASLIQWRTDGYDIALSSPESRAKADERAKAYDQEMRPKIGPARPKASR